MPKTFAEENDPPKYDIRAGKNERFSGVFEIAIRQS